MLIGVHAVKQAVVRRQFFLGDTTEEKPFIKGPRVFQFVVGEDRGGLVYHLYVIKTKFSVLGGHPFTGNEKSVG